MNDLDKLFDSVEEAEEQYSKYTDRDFRRSRDYRDYKARYDQMREEDRE